MRLAHFEVPNRVDCVKKKGGIIIHITNLEWKTNNIKNIKW